MKYYSKIKALVKFFDARNSEDHWVLNLVHGGIDGALLCTQIVVVDDIFAHLFFFEVAGIHCPLLFLRVMRWVLPLVLEFLGDETFFQEFLVDI